MLDISEIGETIFGLDHSWWLVAIAKLIRVLLVDDHVMVRRGVRTLLESYPNIEVVGEAGDGEEARGHMMIRKAGG